MKILHLADTHLGYSAYRKITEEGINQRELDIYDAFTQIIDYAINTKPDLIIHAGDLFDSVRPTNRAITIAMHQLLRLEHAQIPTLIISGNHETPRLKETGHIFTIFEHLKHITLVYNNTYECHHFHINNQKIAIHALPQCTTKDTFTHQINTIKPDPTANYNILTTHGAVTDIKEFKMNEFNELIIPLKKLTLHYDYIALGHYHKHVPLTNNAYYAGSPERLSFTEAPDQKGFLEITLNNNSTPTFIPTYTRPMHDLPPIDCTNIPIDTIQKHISDQLNPLNHTNAIIRLHLTNLTPAIHRAIDYTTIRKTLKNTLHFEIKTHLQPTTHTTLPQNHQITSLTQEFHQYLTKQTIPNKETLEDLGLNYLKKYEHLNPKP